MPTILQDVILSCWRRFVGWAALSMVARSSSVLIVGVEDIRRLSLRINDIVVPPVKGIMKLDSSRVSMDTLSLEI